MVGKAMVLLSAVRRGYGGMGPLLPMVDLNVYSWVNLNIGMCGDVHIV